MYSYRVYWFSLYGGLTKSDPSELGFKKKKNSIKVVTSFCSI